MEKKQTERPTVNPIRFNVAIMGIPTTPIGGNGKGIPIMRDPITRFPPMMVFKLKV